MATTTARDMIVDQIIHLTVTGEAYRALVASIDEVNHARLAYDGETLEIMSPGSKHERIANLISDMLPFVMDEWDIDYRNSGQTTFQTLAPQVGGFEADKSYYIASVKRVRDFDNIDLTVDPPPDLVVEIDILHRRIDKESIYAQAGVTEFWRYEETAGLLAFTFEDGAYTQVSQSRVIQGLPLIEIAKIIGRDSKGDSRSAIVKDWKRWLRDNRNLHSAT